MALLLEHIRLQAGSFRLTADLEIAAGQRIAVMGPSGAGKSTLVNAIAGFQEVAAGRILWQRQEITQAAPGARPVAMVFQDGNLFPHLSIRENAGLGLRPDLRLTPDQWAEVDAALARVGLEGLGTRKPAALSGGQQSRAALARVLLQSRPVLILDEPFAALGPALKAEMLDLVAALVARDGLTLLMVTHDPGDAARIADQVMVVAEGRAAAPQATSKILAHPPEALRAYLGDR